MAMSNLRRTKPLEADCCDLFSQFSENNISFLTINVRTAPPLCNNYPFKDQTIYQGEFEYEEPSRFGQNRTIHLDFEYRSSSNVFIIKSDIDIKISNVISELNSISPSHFQIYRSLTPSREGLWNFFRNSSSLVEMTVIYKEGREMEVAQLDKPVSELAGQYPIESATAVYEFGGKEIVARYTNGTINIDSDDSEANEYITQLFERDALDQGAG